MKSNSQHLDDTKLAKIRKRERLKRVARFSRLLLIIVVACCSIFLSRAHMASLLKTSPRSLRTATPQRKQAAALLPTLAVALPAEKEKVTAASLSATLTRTVAFVSISAKRADPKIVNTKIKRQEPFFAALKKTNTTFKQLNAELKSKDDKKFFKTLSRSGKLVNELEAAYGLSGIKDAKIAEGMKKLVGAFKTFRKNYGKEALRRKKGGPVTAKETEEAKTLEQKYRKTLAELTKLKTSQPKGPGFSQIDKLIFELDALLNPKAPAGAPAVVVGDISLFYFSRLLLFEEDFVGSWYAISSYASLIDPKAYTAYNVIDTYAADLYSYASTVESSFEYSSAEYWSYSESTSVEISESYSVSISETEISQSESYLSAISLDVSVDAYDVTLGNEDVAFIDHDDDGIIDSKDDDDDNDGIPDVKDFDDDGDGIADIAEEDADNDGTPDALDLDDDNDGIPDTEDKDDDGDGIPDDKEVHDNDNDGIADDKDPDDDNDGIPDTKDKDKDGDGIDDAVDTDDDNDGVPDGVDADHDEDGDGTPDATDADDDNDGVPDAEDKDQDNDGISDDKDTDDDNDGIPDVDDKDDDNDGVEDSADADHDNDGDGIPDAADPDDDNDGTPDEADADDDGDGEPDAAEAQEEAADEHPAEEEESVEELQEEEETEEEEDKPPMTIASSLHSF